MVRAVALSPDCKTLVSSSSDPNSQVILQLWDVATGVLLRQFLDGKNFGMPMTTAFSPDGETIAFGSDNNTVIVELWDATAGTLQQVLKGHPSLVFAVVLSQDGKTAASAFGDDTIKLWT